MDIFLCIIKIRTFLTRSRGPCIIKQGTPLIQAIPVKRESWDSECVVYSEGKDEIEKQRLMVRSSFKNSYKEKFRQKKEYK